MKAKLFELRQRFWLWLYRLAGSKVGPEADEFWDRHWWSMVAFRMKELAGLKKAGQRIVKLLFVEDEGHPRDIRDSSREVRDR
jgi:hypothetical protein